MRVDTARPVGHDVSKARGSAVRFKEDRAMTETESQLDLLSIFHYVVGGLTALFSCIFLIHIAMGIAMLTGAFDGETAGPPRLFGLMFVIMPSVIILCGWTLAGMMIAAGRKLKRRVSRTFCLVVAGLECILMPFGTVLGVFTLIILTKSTSSTLGTDFHPSSSEPAKHGLCSLESMVILNLRRE
jgi:hypothetical protein